MKIVVGKKVNRGALESLLKFPEDVEIIENGVRVGTVPSDTIQLIAGNFADYRVHLELDCVENNHAIIRPDFIDYLANELGYSLKNDTVRVIEF